MGEIDNDTLIVAHLFYLSITRFMDIARNEHPCLRCVRGSNRRCSGARRDVVICVISSLSRWRYSIHWKRMGKTPFPDA